jgi:hypothetical protein
VDWAALALLAFEAPSVLFSQDRANSVGASEVVALSIFCLQHLSLYIEALGKLAQALLMLWLLVKGVNVQRWQEQANAASASVAD